MENDSQMQYVSQALRTGKSREEIYLKLLADGFKVEQIENYVAQAVSPAELKEETQKKTIRVVVTIGAVLIGLGIFSFIAANWQEMTRTGKMAVVLISMFCVDAIGWYLNEKIRLAKSAEAMFFLGSIIFGGAVFLAAQMYNTRVYWPDGFLWWMLGSLAAAWALDIASIWWLAAFTGFIGLVWYPVGFFSGELYNPLFLTPWLLLIISTAVLFAVAHRMRRGFLADSPDRY